MITQVKVVSRLEYITACEAIENTAAQMVRHRHEPDLLVVELLPDLSAATIVAFAWVEQNIGRPSRAAYEQTAAALAKVTRRAE